MRSEQTPPYPSYIQELDEAQKKAVLYTDGPALTIAGAGSGKTRVLVSKILYLMDCGIEPHQIMALTFTNKAAREMKERIHLYAGARARGLMMGTFHSIFARVLRTYADKIGFTNTFTIYNTSDSKSTLKKIIKEMNLDDKIYKPNVIGNRISNAKNRLITPSQYKSNKDIAKADAYAYIPLTGEIYSKYQTALKESNVMDFDDLLFYMNFLLRDHEEVKTDIQKRIGYLLIDEYQDTNFAQYMIARQLMSHSGNIFVVGDDAQSIYSFRGANINNILSFQETFKGSKLFKLEKNYRSTKTIVDAANCLIKHNENQIDKNTFSDNDQGERIEIHEATSGDDEAKWVAEEIKRHTARGGSYGNCAILYRTNAQSRILEQEMRKQRIPFVIYGGHAFFDHKEVKDVIAYLKLTINPTDNESFLRVVNYPKRGIGETTMQKLRDEAVLNNLSLYEQTKAQNLEKITTLSAATKKKLSLFHQMIESFIDLVNSDLPFEQCAKKIIQDSGIYADLITDTTPEGARKIDNFKELLNSIDEYNTKITENNENASLPDYLEEVSLMTDQDEQKDNAAQEVVTLMTVHAAKGLEFDFVAILGLEEQLFPSAMCSTQSELEEERRLFYVAITRAKEKCVIGHARQRYRNGSSEIMKPSRFLKELPEAYLVRTTSDFVDPYAVFRGSPHGRKHGDRLPEDFPSAPSDNYLPSSNNSKRKPITPTRKTTYIGTRMHDEVLPQHSSIGNLHVGDSVIHSKFGIGIINGLEGEGDNARVTVNFDECGLKKMVIKFAKLSKL